MSFTYIVPVSTSSANIIKTFTFPNPVMSGSVCVDWAFISCCPAARMVMIWPRTSSSSTDARSVVLGTTAPHYQQGRGAVHWSSARRAVREITLNAWDGTGSNSCAGATVNVKICMTLSDFPTNSNLTAECACDETCTGDASYVAVTGVS